MDKAINKTYKIHKKKKTNKTFLNPLRIQYQSFINLFLVFAIKNKS